MAIDLTRVANPLCSIPVHSEGDKVNLSDTLGNVRADLLDTLGNVRAVLLHLMVRDADIEDDQADFGYYLILSCIEQAVRYAINLIDEERTHG